MGFGGESGRYPPGAEFDPRAPYNDKNPSTWGCDYCGEEFPDTEDHPHFEALDGDTCCYSCLAEALEVALLEVGKLRVALDKAEEPHVRP